MTEINSHLDLYKEVEKRKKERKEPEKKLYEIDFTLSIEVPSNLGSEKIKEIADLLLEIGEDDRSDNKFIKYLGLKRKQVTAFKYYEKD